MGKRFFCGMLLLFFLAPLSAFSVDPPHLGKAAADEKGSESAAAREAIDAGDFDKAVTLLKPRLDAKSEGAEAAHLHYLMGLAVFGKVDAEIKEQRKQGSQRVDKLEKHQLDMLKEALEHFRTVVDLDPGSSDAPEAQYMSALLLDYGYLQRFGQVTSEYRKVVEQYPDSEAAKKAQGRLTYHENLFKHYQKAPPNMKDSPH